MNSHVVIQKDWFILLFKKNQYLLPSGAPEAQRSLSITGQSQIQSDLALSCPDKRRCEAPLVAPPS